MISFFVQMGFGLVVIASAFLVFVFWRAYDDRDKRGDARYRLVSLSLCIGSVGVGMWAFNPLLQSFGGPSLPLPGLVVASGLILVSATSLVGSTAMGSNKRTLKAFLLTCAGWIIFCVGKALL